MQYIGGKQKSGGAAISRALNATIAHHEIDTYLEPFCGGLSVLARVQAPRRQASDACEALVTLYQAIQAGWTPPTELDKEGWSRLRDANDPTDPLTAFAGFGCSFGGSWFSSYAARYKYTKRWVTAAQAAASSLDKKMRKCRDVVFRACDYRGVEPTGLVYCDPPYRGTMGYGAVPDWDPVAFWAWAEDASTKALVAVSEMQAPAGWVPLLTFSVQNRIATGAGNRRQEFLFVAQNALSRWKVAT